jgi:hypothetical protein
LLLVPAFGVLARLLGVVFGTAGFEAGAAFRFWLL